MGGQQVAEGFLVGGGGAEGEFELFGPGVVAVQGVVGVGAEASVEVLGGLYDAADAFGCPDLGDGDVRGGGSGPPAPVLMRQAACQRVTSMARRSM